MLAVMERKSVQALNAQMMRASAWVVLAVALAACVLLRAAVLLQASLVAVIAERSFLRVLQECIPSTKCCASLSNKAHVTLLRIA